MIQGLGVSPGIGIAIAVRIIKQEHNNYEKTTVNADAELELLKSALHRVTEETQMLYAKTLESIGEEQAKIFVAHSMILEDPELTEALTAAIVQEHYTAAFAVEEIMSKYVAMFETMEDDYMRERAADMCDIRERLMCAILNSRGCGLESLPGPTVITADDLTPSDTAAMDLVNVKGIVTKGGGKTSHTAIIARSVEIPVVAGVGDAIEEIKTGDLLIIDGSSGEIYINPDETTLDLFKARQKESLTAKELMKEYRDKATITQDGKKIELAANIGTPQEMSLALEKGAEGIGLFRSEFLFMDRPVLPTEDEQFQAYKKVIEGMNGKRVIIRTLDIGGDKKLPAIDIQPEENPFLGYRAIRLCLGKKDLFRTQLRALLRASIYGNLHIMLPMISCVQEVRQAKAIIEEVKTELTAEGKAYVSKTPVGIMIEIPAAAVIANILAKEVDFFSIGTNDLIQYTTATDRGNEKVSYLYTPYHPAVLRLIAMTIKAAHENGIFCGMCGEAAGDERLAPVWIGLGIDELSVSSASILQIRRRINSLSYERCEKIAGEAVSLSSSDEVSVLLDSF